MMVDATKIDSFLENHKILYPSLIDIVNGLSWRIMKGEKCYYNEKQKVYMIKSSGEGTNIYVTLAFKIADNIYVIEGILVREKYSNKILTYPPEK